MRLSAAIAFVLLAVPALAADSIADQAQAAFGVFGAGKSQSDFTMAGTGSVTFKGIAGRWVNLNGPAPVTGIETYGPDTEKFCKGAAVFTIASPDTMTLTLSAKPVGVEFTQIYTLIAGSTYAQYTEPTAYFAAIGLGPDKVGPEFDRSRILALSLANGIVQIYRPSDDILVFTRDKAYPTVMARCPQS
jgi:hypothetical protein